MVFTNPAALWGLLALAIPLIVHLLNLQRPRRQVFPQLALLRELNQSAVRQRRWKRWLLLLIRLLTIAAIVLLFAGPTFPEDTGDEAQVGGRKSVLVVLDNSLSMQASGLQGNLFEAARNTARSIVEAHAPDEAFLVLASGGLGQGGAFVPQTNALQDLQKLGLSPQAKSLPAILREAEARFQQAEPGPKVLYVISDFQRRTLLTDTLGLPQAPNFRVVLVPLSAGIPGNVYLSNVQLSSRQLAPGQPAAVVAELRTTGQAPNAELKVSLELEDQAVAFKTLELDQEQQGPQLVQLDFTPPKTGWLQGRLTVQDPRVPFDNTRYLSLYVPPSLPLLLVQEEPSPYLETLLDSILPYFKVKRLVTSQLSTAQLDSFRAVVLEGVGELPVGQALRLQQWTQRGNGLLLFPPEQKPGPELNKLLSQLPVGPWGELQKTRALGWQAPELNNPLFAGMFTREADAGNLTFDSPGMQQYRKLKPGAEAEIALQADNGDPVLVQQQVGQGQALVYALRPKLAWSNWPIKSLFAPLMDRSLRYVAQLPPTPLSRTIGQAGVQRFPAGGETLVKLEALGEQAQVLIPPQQVIGGSRRVNFDQVEARPGHYRLVQQDSLLALVGYNLPTAESDLDLATESELRRQLDDWGLQQADILAGEPNQVIRDIAGQSPTDRSLIPWLALLGLMLLVGETLLIGPSPFARTSAKA